MILNPTCAACGAKDWEILGKLQYTRDTVHKTPYLKVRQEVLFECWFPGTSNVSLHPILCKQCGFLCYKPRPESEDIANKYAYITQHESGAGEFSATKQSDVPRSRALYSYLHKLLKPGANSILDYGGGNGRLLGDFVGAGHRCETMDLVAETVEGVIYAGSHPSELQNRPSYDLIICSHVLEHLADPLSMLTELRQHVGESGLIYVEVPSEIWNRVPLGPDPVTHINFFTTDSLSALLANAGLDIVCCHYDTFISPSM